MKRLCPLLVLVALCGQPAIAHHSFAAAFAEERITIEGTITRVNFKNPHVNVYLNVENEDGTTTRWLAEGAAAVAFRLAVGMKGLLKRGGIFALRVMPDAMVGLLFPFMIFTD